MIRFNLLFHVGLKNVLRSALTSAHPLDSVDIGDGEALCEGDDEERNGAGESVEETDDVVSVSRNENVSQRQQNQAETAGNELFADAREQLHVDERGDHP